MLKFDEQLEKEQHQPKHVAAALLSQIRAQPCAQDGADRWRIFVKTHLAKKRNLLRKARSEGRTAVLTAELATELVGFDFNAMRAMQSSTPQQQTGRAPSPSAHPISPSAAAAAAAAAASAALPRYLRQGQGPASFTHTGSLGQLAGLPNPLSSYSLLLTGWAGL